MKFKGIVNKCRSFGNWYKHQFVGQPWWRKILAGIASLFVALILFLFAVDINFLWLFGKSPGWFDISEHKTSQASELYSADGVLMGKYFNENRTPVNYNDVNPVFWKALIDTEDERYFSHWGIDPMGIVGAAKDAATGRGGRGASTITQQLAKNMFRVRSRYSTGLFGYIPGVKILIMKAKEWITATKLELYFSFTKGRNEGKREILTMYANTVDFGSNAFGIKTACKTYFNTSPKDMTADQAAILVGLLKATTYYNPRINPENALNRRNTVLDNMVKHGDLSKEEYNEFSQLPISLDYSVESNYDGQATYFREAVANYLKDWCEENDVDLYNDGLKIYTSVDSRMQKYAEAAAIKQMKQVQRNFKSHWGSTHPWQDEKHQEIEGFIEGIAQRLPVYKYLQNKFSDQPDSIIKALNTPHRVKLFDYERGTIEQEMSTMDSIRYMVSFMHCGFVAMEPQTGHVKAWVGDIDFATWKYDKVTAMRQPGSTFKLFVYTEAMNQGLTPCDKRMDSQVSIMAYDPASKTQKPWTPTNANGYFTGDSMPLKGAFAKSINSVAVKLGQEVGIENIIRTAHKMGIKSQLDATPSLTLGSSDVNLLELVNSYCTVADDGKAHEPVLVTKIINSKGDVIYQAETESTQAIPYRSAYLMQQMLQGGMREPGGTSQSLWGYVGNHSDTEFGGKTGTSNNHSDAWFVGVSKNLVAGAWVGGEYRCIHFRTGALGQGSRTALPICGYFFQAVLDDPAFKQYHGKFGKPTDPEVNLGLYTCSSYYESQRNDSTAGDSLAIITETEVNINDDELGEHPAAEPAVQEEQKPQRPKEQKMSFDDF